MPLSGPRALDDRRRRRLAVSGDSVDGAETGLTGGLGVLRERLGAELPAAAPWIPRQPWKRSVMATVFWLGLVGIAITLIQPWPPHPRIAPMVDHLATGSRSNLLIYSEIVLWTLAGQFAALVGWYRSHSTLDFRGRYRLWAWAALVCTGWGFLAGTGVAAAAVKWLDPQWLDRIWRGDVLAWLLPACVAGVSISALMDADLRRCRGSLIFVRLAVMTLLAVGLGHLASRELAPYEWYVPAMTAGYLVGLGLLITGLWFQAWYVAYVCADPPELVAGPGWRVRGLALMSYARSWWPTRAVAVEDAKPKRRSRKKEEPEEEDGDAAPKRKRKTAAKTKRTTKPRTRTKPEPELTEDEEAWEEEATDENWDETTADEAAEDSSDDSEDWSEDEELLEQLTAPEPKAAAKPSSASSSASAGTPAASRPSTGGGSNVAAKASPSGRDSTTNRDPQSSRDGSGSRSPVLDRDQQSASRYDNDSDEEDEDSEYRVDGGHEQSELFKGLSKRQRRELKKQLRDQERQRDR